MAVLHSGSGGDMSGSFLWSLTATDIYSRWTEIRSSWNRGQHSVCTAFEGIEQCLPFVILEVDTDNGGEPEAPPKIACRRLPEGRV